MIDDNLSALFAREPARRLAALDEVANTADDRRALRGLLDSDPDARVRAGAATRLGRAGEPSCDEALLERTQLDPMPLVREAAWRSLARHAPVSAWRTARDAIVSDPVWWVRTAAVSALAAIGRRRDRVEGALALMAALDDPFWRVRHAAVRAIIATAGSDDRAVIDRVLATAPRTETAAAAIEYMRRRWAGDDSGDLDPAPLSEAPDDPLWDPDPAVITSRLEDPKARPSLGMLVELLADPHEPLRKLAIRHLSSRVRESGDRRVLRAALCWLEEPRIPRGPDAVVSMLNRMGELAAEVAADVFDDPPGQGALVWALRWVAATRADELASEVAPCLEDMSPAVREAALAALSALGLAGDLADRIVAMAAADPDPSVRAEAIAAAADCAGPALLDRVPRRSAPPPARREMARLAARLRRVDWLTEAAADPDPTTRAIAIAHLVAERAIDPQVLAAALDDPEPTVRIAGLQGDEDRMLPIAVSDPDPRVRRAALRSFSRTGSSPPGVPETFLGDLVGDPDPGVRARLCAVLDITPANLRALLRLTFDRDPSVRAAAVSAFELVSDESIRALLETEGDATVRKAAHTWLSRALDDDAAAALRDAHAAEAPEVRAHLEAIAMTLPESAGELIADIPIPERAPRRRRAREPIAVGEVERRPLGDTGLEVAPLALSGAKDLVTQGFDRALERGVNLYFWEPRYQTLGRFLRSRRVSGSVHVVAGSYHGSPDAIEADVDTALRRLRRDRIDVFLLYWVRSEARLNDEVFERLARLKDAGKIGAAGFSTHHRDLAEAAIAARPWDVLMTRHSAAHPGAEASLLDAARARGVGVLGFSALCYGRLLQPSPGHEAPDAADCYRYSLSQPIDAVISAPARYRELVENLEVLERPTLDGATIAALREHGRWVHAQSADFGALVRRTPRELPRHTADHLSAILESLEPVDRR